MEPFCDRMINRDSLLKLISSSNKMLADQGHLCIMSLIQSVRPPKIIGRIADEISSKNPFMRLKVVEYMIKMLQVLPASVIEKHSSHFENVIFHGVSDAGQQTRAEARKAYKLYSEICPGQAEKLHSKFDSSIQKKLKDPKNQNLETDRNGGDEEVDENEEEVEYEYEEEDVEEKQEEEEEQVDNSFTPSNSNKGFVANRKSLFNLYNDGGEEENKSRRDVRSVRKESKKRTDKDASDNEESMKSRSTATSKKNRSGSSVNMTGLNSIAGSKSENGTPKKVSKSVKPDSKVKDLLSSYREGPQREEEESPTKGLWASQRGSPKSLIDGALAAMKKKEPTTLLESQVMSPLFLKVKAVMESKGTSKHENGQKAKLVNIITPMSEKKNASKTLSNWRSSGNITVAKTQVVTSVADTSTKRKSIKNLTTPPASNQNKNKSLSPLQKNEVNRLLILIQISLLILLFVARNQE